MIKGWMPEGNNIPGFYKCLVYVGINMINVLVPGGNNIPGCYQLNAVDAHDQPQTFENKYTRLLGLIL